MLMLLLIMMMMMMMIVIISNVVEMIFPTKKDLFFKQTYRISTFFCEVQIPQILRKSWGLKFCVLFFCASESDKRMDFITALYFDDGQVTVSVLERYTLYMYYGCYRLQLKKRRYSCKKKKKPHTETFFLM